jgi:hypothetical protein
VGDQEHRAAVRGGEHVAHEGSRRRAVEMGRRLVQDEHRGVRQQGAGDCDPPALTAGELASVLAHGRVPAARQ